MTPLEKFEQLSIDASILQLSPQNHNRRKYVREFILTDELLRYLMETLDYSAYYISQSIFLPVGYIVGAGEIIKICKEYGIKTKTMSEAANSIHTRKLYKSTCLDIYGEINSFSKNTTAYKKRNKTVRQKYGVENVFQLKSVQQKTKDTLFAKYGVYTPVNLPWHENNCGRKSKLHLQIEAYLISKNIKFESEIKNKFTKFNKLRNKQYSPIVDILIEDKKLVIEVNGDCWHANPKLYKPSDVIRKFGGMVSAKEIRKFDRSRNNQIRSFGYDVIELWEYDIKHNFKKIEEIIYEKILKN